MMKSYANLNFFLKLCSLAAITFGLTACQAMWDTSPDFGSSVNDAIKSQLVNPKAPLGNQQVTSGLDGSVAKSAVDNYQKSFEVRSPTSSGTYPTGATSGSSPGSK